MIQLPDILRPGITGCINKIPDRNDDAVIAAWREACHRCSRALRGKRIGEEPVATARNFHSLTLELYPQRETIHILLHAVLPFVGLATQLGWNDNHYADSGRVEPFFESPFIVIPGDLLEQQFDLEPWMTDALDEAALRDIRYWKPRRVGDVMFNYYD